MSKWVYGLIGLVIGGAAGFVIGKMVTEKKAFAESERKISEMEEYYGKTDAYARQNRDEDGDDERPEEGVNSVKNAQEAAKNRRRSPETDVDYTKYYKPTMPTTAEDNPDCVDEDPDDDQPYNESMEYEEEHRKNRNKPPRIISDEDACNLPGYIEMETLFYYTGNDTVTNEEDTPVDDPCLLIGNALDKFDFRNSLERTIYVMNYSIDKCFEITKVDAEYVEEV